MTTQPDGREFIFWAWGKPERRFTLRDPTITSTDERTATVHVLDEEGRPLDLRLTLPDARWLGNGPLAAVNRVPVRLERCALALPHCCASKAEFEALADPRSPEYLAAAYANPVTLAAGRIYEDGWTKGALDGFRRVVETRHDWQRAVVEELLKELSGGKHSPMLMTLCAQARVHPAILASGRIWEDSWVETDFPGFRERWAWDAFGKIKEARNSELVRRWAEQHDLDLESIPEQADLFRLWLAGAAESAAASVRNTIRGTPVLVKVPVARISPDGWRFLAALIRYVLTFEGRQRVWLEDVQAQPVTTSEAVSVPGIARPSRGGAEAGQPGTASAPGPARCQATPGFALVRPLDRRGRPGKAIPVPRMLRALLVALAESPGRTLTHREATAAITQTLKSLDRAAGITHRPTLSADPRLRRILRSKEACQLERAGLLRVLRDARGRTLSLQLAELGEG